MGEGREGEGWLAAGWWVGLGEVSVLSRVPGWLAG